MAGITSLRFLALGSPAEFMLDSSAFRLLLRDFNPFSGEAAPETGLVARLPLGLMLCVSGLCALGLVARLATIECPPKLGDPTGDDARELLASVWGLTPSPGLGVCELARTSTCWGCC